MILMIYNIYIYLHVLGAKERQTLEFSDICRIYLGRVGDWAAFLFSLAAIFGALIVFYVLMSNFLFNTGHYIYGKQWGRYMCKDGFYYIPGVLCQCRKQIPDCQRSNI